MRYAARLELATMVVYCEADCAVLSWLRIRVASAVSASSLRWSAIASCGMAVFWIDVLKAVMSLAIDLSTG